MTINQYWKIGNILTIEHMPLEALSHEYVIYKHNVIISNYINYIILYYTIYTILYYIISYHIISYHIYISYTLYVIIIIYIYIYHIYIYHKILYIYISPDRTVKSRYPCLYQVIWSNNPGCQVTPWPLDVQSASRWFSWDRSTDLQGGYPLVNIQKAIENGPFIVDLPIKNGDFQ